MEVDDHDPTPCHKNGEASASVEKDDSSNLKQNLKDKANDVCNGLENGKAAALENGDASSKDDESVENEKVEKEVGDKAKDDGDKAKDDEKSIKDVAEEDDNDKMEVDKNDDEDGASNNDVDDEVMKDSGGDDSEKDNESESKDDGSGSEGGGEILEKDASDNNKPNGKEDDEDSDNSSHSEEKENNVIDLSSEVSDDKKEEDEQKSKDVESVNDPTLVKTVSVDKDNKNDSEKENVSKSKPSTNNISKDGASSSGNKKTISSNDMGNDDIEIIGTSKVVSIDSPSSLLKVPQNVVLVNPGMSSNSANSSKYSGYKQNIPGGLLQSTLMQPIAIHSNPPKPKSSLDQIELIRWEIQNRINTRPKYFKPNPTAELGPLSKFLFDIGSNLIKEAVYHELVKIQSKKNDDNVLSEKEKEDLEKLKDIEKDLHGQIGHLKLKMRKKCKVCHFQSESGNVMYHHKQFPHEDDKKLYCAHCIFVTKQPQAFKFHTEAEHGVQPRLHDKKAFWECDLCPYENNAEPKLIVHKQRCAKQFRPLFNLHPSCLSGAEINLCLENIFYKPVIPKNLKLLQQKHAQQQAALAAARRQQAEMNALAAQKNAMKQAALQSAKKRQQAIMPRTSAAYNHNTRNQNRQLTPVGPPRQNNVRPSTPSSAHSMIANSLNKEKASRNNTPKVPTPVQPATPGGFEVCEICGGYVKDRKALRIHFFYAHRIDLPFNLFDRSQPPLYCATCFVRFWTAQGLRKHIDVHMQEKKTPEGFISEGVHGKCISCGQLVGNIVVHMRVVHSREIHHYINALMCMFCGASFNSRPNVEKHITDVHGTVDIATGAIKVKAKLKAAPSPQQQSSRQPTHSNNGPAHNSGRKSGGGAKDSLVKGSVCVLCNLNFGRNVDLTRHCMRMHHTCMKCGMVVIDKASLLKHTCLTSPSGTRDCSMCSESGFHPAYYVKHLRDKHLKKFNITVARTSAPVIERWIKRPYPFTKQKEGEFVEISDSEDDDEAEEEPIVAAPSPSPPSPEPEPVKLSECSPRNKKARLGPASKIGRGKAGDADEESEKSSVKRKASAEDEGDGAPDNKQVKV